MTCDRLHALTLVVYLQLWQLYSTLIHVIIMCITVQLFILLFSLFYLLLLLYMHMVSSARAVSPLHTHTLIMVAFWRPWVCTSSYWTIISNVQVFDETVRFANSWSSFLFYSGILISVIILLLSWFSLYRFQLPFSCHYSSAIIVIVMYMYCCSDSMIIRVLIIACSG